MAKAAFPGWAGAIPAERAVRRVSEACVCSDTEGEPGQPVHGMAMEAVKLPERSHEGFPA